MVERFRGSPKYTYDDTIGEDPKDFVEDHMGDYNITFKQACPKCPFYVSDDYWISTCNLAHHSKKAPKLLPQSLGIPDKCPLKTGKVVVTFRGNE